MSIISTGSRVDTPYDIYLEVDNQKIGFMLNDVEGIMGYRPSLAAQVTPQFNTASFDYASVPIEVEIPVAHENWQGGCGFNSVEYEEAGSLTKYSFSRGVDSSYAGRLYAGPNHFSNTNYGNTNFFTSGDDATPEVKFYYAPSTGRLWAFGGQYLYYHSSEYAWLESTAIRLSSDFYFSDIVDFRGVLFVAVMRKSTLYPINYYYSTNSGTTWTQSTLANSAIAKFAIRGETSGSPILWGMATTGALRTNTDATNTGGAWSSPIQMGDTTDDYATGCAVAGNYVYVFKQNSIWRTDGTSSLNVWQNFGNEERWSAGANGSRPFVWIDAQCYVQYGRRLLQIDPFNNTMTIVWPPSAAQVGSEELNGRITGISGDSDWLYISLINNQGVSYIMKGKPNTTNWHTLTYTETPAIKGIKVVSPSLLNSTNPFILYGTDATGSNSPSYGTLRSVPLPKVGMLPDEDPDYTFSETFTQAQYIVGPWVDVGQAASPKLLNGARLLSRTANSSSPSTVSYVTDSNNYSDTFIENVQKGDVTGIEIGTATDDDATFRITTEVRFNKIRYILKMTRNTVKNAASIESVVLDTTIAPERRRLFECDIIIGDDLQLKGGGVSRFGAKVLEAFLFNASNRLITLTDIFNRTYSVKMLDLQAQGVATRDGRDYQVYTVSFAQINQLTDIGDNLIYDTSAWNTGRIYS